MKKKLKATELASLNEIEQMVDEALAEVRTVSYLLHPPVLDLLKIHDDGVGFGDNCQQGIGIAGMRERLKELNGTLEVKSSTESV